MRKILKRIGICALAASLLWGAMILTDKQALRKELIRLHVVASSDSERDQALKLQVRDAVVLSLQQELKNVTDVQQAKTYLQENLSAIETLANEVLQKAGSNDLAVASLQQEAFDIRYYDTFTLPSGIYDALRITIGAGQGHNWWCVVFPALCIGATVEDFEDTAQCAGLSQSLTATLTGDETYEVRFLVLDALGRLENFLHKE